MIYQNQLVLLVVCCLYKFVLSTLQRITSLCKLLNKPDDATRRYLQGMTTSESMDLSALLLAENQQKTLPAQQTPAPSRPHHDNHLDTDNSHRTTRESDSESGFEDGSSQMSKSMNDEVGLSMQTSGLMSTSISIENLCLDSLVTELKSVAVEWKSFRAVRVCSCAIPFEHFTKKVS